jgi:hypothetical protein
MYYWSLSQCQELVTFNKPISCVKRIVKLGTMSNIFENILCNLNKYLRDTNMLVSLVFGFDMRQCDKKYLGFF